MINPDFEKKTIELLKKQFRLNIEEACFSSGVMPKYILLDRTRNIHSYFVYLYHDNGAIYSLRSGRNSNFKDTLIHIIRKQYSELDRPVFFIIQDSEGQTKVMEGGEIREHLLENSGCCIEKYILANASLFSEVVCQIKREL